MNTTKEPVPPKVPWIDLWPHILALGAAILIPLVLLVFDLAERKPDLFQRGGIVALFIVVVLEFVYLSDLTKKHVYNALRAKYPDENNPIQDVSHARRNLNWVSLIVGLYGAAISAFGDKFVVALVKLLCT